MALHGVTALETPTLLHPQACRANFERGIAIVRSPSGDTNDRMNQSFRHAALGIHQL